MGGNLGHSLGTEQATVAVQILEGGLGGVTSLPLLMWEEVGG